MKSCLALILLAAGLPVAAASTPPAVTCLLDGQPARLVAVEGGRLIVEQNGHRRPAPAGATWQVPFDELAAAGHVCWTPSYELTRANEAELAILPDRPWRGHVSTIRGRRGSDDSRRGVAQEWPGAGPGEGAFIAVWLNDRRPAQIMIVPVPTDDDEEVTATLTFRLAATEANGFPVTLFWQDNTFAAARPAFDDEATRQAALAILHNDAPGLANALQAGASTDARTPTGLTLADLAAQVGAVSALETLHAHNRKLVTRKSRNGSPPLRHAAACDRREAVRWLLQAPINAGRDSETAALALLAAIDAGHTECVRMLLNDAKPLRYRHTATSALANAVCNGFPDVVQALLDARVKLPDSKEGGASWLHLCARNGFEQTARLLLDRGVDAKEHINGFGVLHVAARQGSAAFLETLLAAGADARATTSTGYTTLMAAAEGANRDAATVLLQHGADVNGATREGVTALHIAARHDAGEVVELLLQQGADHDAQTERGFSALDIALLSGAGGAARVLALAGAEIDLASPHAGQMLECAIRHDIPEPLEGALAAGWPAQSTFGGVWPALQVAEIFHSTQCAQRLRAAGATVEPDQPAPVALPRELDEPVRTRKVAMPDDPREAFEEFPATRVEVELLVSPEGRALFPRVLNSTDPRLGPAVFEAVRHWQFVPPRRQGQPVAVRVMVPLIFPASAHRSFAIAALHEIPRPISRVPPMVPMAAKMQSISGTVTIAFVVTTEGTVADAHVVESSHRMFEEPALEAVRQWRFEPGRINGRPVNTRMQQPIIFSINL